MEPGRSAVLVTGDPSRNKVLTVPGGAFATVKIRLPRDWDALMAERGYAPLSSFRVAPAAPAASSAPAAPPPSAQDGAWRGADPATRPSRRPPRRSPGGFLPV